MAVGLERELLKFLPLPKYIKIVNIHEIENYIAIHLRSLKNIISIKAKEKGSLNSLDYLATRTAILTSTSFAFTNHANIKLSF